MAEKRHLPRGQFMATCDELLTTAKRIVARLEGFDGRYWTHMDGYDAISLAGDAHVAHKAAVAIRNEFND
jgi:hypothetical protein